MVTKRPSSNTNPRSAGQAPSPQNIARNAPSASSVARRASPGVAYASHGSGSEAASFVVSNMRYSPDPADESDSCSDCCSCSEDDEYETDFSSRATSPDDDFETGEDVLARRKRQIVDGSMLLFRWAVYKWFAEISGVIAHAGEGGRGTKRSADQMSGRQSSNHPPTGGKKRSLRSDEGGGVGEEEGSDHEGGRKPGKKKAKPDPRFACPYYKHDHMQYRSQRTCCGPGFKNVHRVKEHLERRHLMPPYICHECHEVCATQPQLAEHYRTPGGCSKQQHSLPDGITEAKLKEIKARQSGQMTEREKWERMYHILFPDDDRVPSPYYDDESEAESANAAQVPEDMKRAAQYFRLQVFPQARRELERVFDCELEGVSKVVRNRALDIWQQEVFKFMQITDYGRQQSQLSSLPPSPRPDSGVATPEPVQACAQPSLDFPTLLPNSSEDFSFDRYDFSGFFGNESIPQDIEDILERRADDDGCASASNHDSTYGTVTDEFLLEQTFDLPALGFS